MSIFFIGLDIATSTGMAIVDAEGRPVWGMQGGWLKVTDALREVTPPAGDVRVYYEMPFVGENKRAAMNHAYKVGAITGRVCEWAGFPLARAVDFQPKEWRRIIGCPMDRVAAKAWCTERAAALGFEVAGPRGGSLHDLAEAWGVAEAGRRIHAKGDPEG